MASKDSSSKLNCHKGTKTQRIQKRMSKKGKNISEEVVMGRLNALLILVPLCLSGKNPITFAEGL